MSTTTTIEYSLEEIKKHNTPNDLWIILHGGVYDITKFREEHPGGPEILDNTGGQDATEKFEDVYHSKDARKRTIQYRIGTVKGYTGDPNDVLSESGSSSSSITPNERQQSNTIPLLMVALCIIVAVLYKLYS